MAKLYQTTILDWSKLKAFADEIINVAEKIEICFGKGRKHCGKRRKCFFFKVVKSWDCVVKSHVFHMQKNGINISQSEH